MSSSKNSGSQKQNEVFDDNETPVHQLEPDHENWLSTFLLIGAVIVFAIVVRRQKHDDTATSTSIILENKPNKPQKLSPNDPNYRSRVNEHLQRLDRDNEIRRQELEIENSLKESIGNAPIEDRPIQEPVGFEFKQDPRTSKTSQDVISPSQKPDPQRDLENQVSSKLMQNQHNREYEKIYEREYIRAFIENARKAGYDIKVDKDLRVIEPSDPNSK